MQNEEFIQDFIDEATTGIETIEAGLLNLNGDNDISDNIHAIFRAIHSIKGTAGFFGLKKIVELAHAMENVLGEIRNNKMAVNNNIIDILLTSNDCLRFMVDNVKESENVTIQEHLNKLAGLLDAKKTSDMQTDRAQNVQAAESFKAAETESKLSDSSIRVNVSLLNGLLNLASEMVLGRNQLLRSMEAHRKNIPGIDPILQNIDRITTELQEKVMQTRMQPVANIFNRFPRVIRDLAKQLNKNVQLYMEGTEVELDKSIIEALSEPLTHLIRNAVDHGIELPAVREKAGKSVTGRVMLKAYHEGGHVNIDVSDDGAGINIEIIKQKAIEKGFVTAADLLAMKEQEILRMLFKQGFSTADNVSDISGRGVGLDVVAANIAKLGGTVEVYTELGKGTIFRLILPLTLAIIPSLIVEVKGHKFALPQVNLQEVVRVKSGDSSKRIEFINNAEVLRLRNKLLPIIHLEDIIGVCSVDNNKLKANREDSSTDRITRILVIRTGSKRFGLAVDRIYDEEEILVKPLPKYLKNCICYSGVTILGDGKTAMILDVDGIASFTRMEFMEEPTGNTEEQSVEYTENNKSMRKLLIFKCSANEILAMDMSMVSRVEKIECSEIEKIGDKEYIKYLDGSLRVIRPEDYLPINKEPLTRNHLYVIIPKLRTSLIGILATEIRDTLEVEVHQNEASIKSRGLSGSAIINHRITLFLDVNELVEMAEKTKCDYKGAEVV